MDFDIQKQLDLITSTIASMDPVKATIFIVAFISIWFLPTILAVFFNRKSMGKIFLANIPAGLSWAVWGALIVWSFTGKIKSNDKKEETTFEVKGGES